MQTSGRSDGISFSPHCKGKRKIGFVLRQMHFLVHTLLFGFFHGADELVQLQRLIEVIHSFELDGVFRVFFIGIAAEEDDLQRWVRDDTSLMSAMPSSFGIRMSGMMISGSVSWMSTMASNPSAASSRYHVHYFPVAEARMPGASSRNRPQRSFYTFQILPKESTGAFHQCRKQAQNENLCTYGLLHCHHYNKIYGKFPEPRHK